MYILDFEYESPQIKFSIRQMFYSLIQWIECQREFE